MQTAEIKKEEIINEKNQKISIDSEKIKNIMAKIQLKPPEWATSYEIYNSLEILIKIGLIFGK